MPSIRPSIVLGGSVTTCLMRSALKAADPVPRFSLLTRWASSDQARAGVSPCLPPVCGPWPAPAAPALPGLGRQAPLAVGLCLRDGPSSSLQWTVQMHTLTSCPCVSPENAAQCAALGKSPHPRLALVLAAWHTGPPPSSPAARGSIRCSCNSHTALRPPLRFRAHGPAQGHLPSPKPSLNRACSVPVS